MKDDWNGCGQALSRLPHVFMLRLATSRSVWTSGVMLKGNFRGSGKDAAGDPFASAVLLFPKTPQMTFKTYSGPE